MTMDTGGPILKSDGLPHSGKIANDLLHKGITKHGYYECAIAPGSWSHQWHIITFVLLVDDFGVEYVRERHARHLQMALEENYEITMDWEGGKYAGIDIKWDYTPVHKNRKARLSMEDYIDDLLSKVFHTKPIGAQLSPRQSIRRRHRYKRSAQCKGNTPYAKNCRCATLLWSRC